jgi:predicted transposase YdaD
MKTDKHIHTLLTSSPEAFRFLTGGLNLTGSYQDRSIVFKELERRADHVFEPDDGVGPVYILEIQTQRSGDVYDRLVLELVLYRKLHPNCTVHGLVLFIERSGDEPESPWQPYLGHGSLLLKPVYLDEIIERARSEQPDHPLLAAFLPLVANNKELAQQASAAWQQLAARTEPDATALMDVFTSWLMERYKHQSYAEVMAMFYIPTTPLEETRAYQQLVGIGMEKGRIEGRTEGRIEGRQEGRQEGRYEGRKAEARAILTKQLKRRFGDLPNWAVKRLQRANIEQLEAWAEQIFDAADVATLLGTALD